MRPDQRWPACCRDVISLTSRPGAPSRCRPGLVLLCLLLAGCWSAGSNGPHGLPSRHEISIDQLNIRSDIPIAADDPLLEELRQLRQEIIRTLDLPPARRPVVVHLFRDEQRYTAYMKAAFPKLPPRRAFFIGSPTELAVYAYLGDNLAEDLRHEYTHGVLHAALRSVPLWLDEGLAEYFETTAGGPAKRHPEHIPRLAVAIQNGWHPDLARLELLEDVAEMQRADYQEAWAWVHYLLHDAPEGRSLLVDYCKSLRVSDVAPSFAETLSIEIPEAESRLTAYIAISLPTDGNAGQIAP